MESFTLIGETPEDYFCDVCSKIMIIPVFLPNCGHTICESCAKRIESIPFENDNRHCPTCREKLPRVVDTFKQNFLIKKMILAVEAECILCQKRSELCHILDHVCPEKAVPCRYEGCELRIKIKEMEDHCGECPKKRIDCNECHTKQARESMHYHLSNECPKRCTHCPLGCQSEVQRDEMTIHLFRCEKRVKKCDIPGCHVSGNTQQLDDHMERRAGQHVRLLGDHASKLAGAIIRQAEHSFQKRPVAFVSYLWRIPNFKAEVARLKESSSNPEPLTSEEFCFSGCKWRLLLTIPQYKVYIQLVSSVRYCQLVNVRFALLGGGNSEVQRNLEGVEIKEGEMYGGGFPTRDLESFVLEDGFINVKVFIEIFQYV